MMQATRSDTLDQTDCSFGSAVRLGFVTGSGCQPDPLLGTELLKGTGNKLFGTITVDASHSGLVRVDVETFGIQSFKECKHLTQAGADLCSTAGLQHLAAQQDGVALDAQSTNKKVLKTLGGFCVGSGDVNVQG